MTYNLNKKLIEDLREGRIAVENSGNVELLKLILNTTFPKDTSKINGNSKYYFKDEEEIGEWYPTEKTKLPTIPLLDFIEKEEWKYTVDYCRQNPVAIKVENEQEAKECEKLIDHDVLTTLGKTTFALYLCNKEQYSAETGEFRGSSSYYTRENYEIINASDFIKNNTKTMDKYSIKELETRTDIVVYIDSQEEFNRLAEITEKLTFKYYGKYCYSLAYVSFSSSSTKNSSGSYGNVKIITVNDIKEYMENKEEIIGYKAPFDMFKGNVKKGTIYITTHGTHYTINGKGFDYQVPNEIVETWEPVYKTSEKVLTLSNGKQVRIAKDKIEAEGKEYAFTTIKTIVYPFATPHGHKIEITEGIVKIGCWYITVADIKLIIKEYKQLNK